MRKLFLPLAITVLLFSCNSNPKMLPTPVPPVGCTPIPKLTAEKMITDFSTYPGPVYHFGVSFDLPCLKYIVSNFNPNDVIRIFMANDINSSPPKTLTMLLQVKRYDPIAHTYTPEYYKPANIDINLSDFSGLVPDTTPLSSTPSTSDPTLPDYQNFTKRQAWGMMNSTPITPQCCHAEFSTLVNEIYNSNTIKFYYAAFLAGQGIVPGEMSPSPSSINNQAVIIKSSQAIGANPTYSIPTKFCPPPPPPGCGYQ